MTHAETYTRNSAKLCERANLNTEDHLLACQSCVLRYGCFVSAPLLFSSWVGQALQVMIGCVPI